MPLAVTVPVPVPAVVIVRLLGCDAMIVGSSISRKSSSSVAAVVPETGLAHSVRQSVTRMTETHEHHHFLTSRDRKLLSAIAAIDALLGIKNGVVRGFSESEDP